jgi:hypothetical protein
MKLKVINPDGVHCKEIKGLKELEASLPSSLSDLETSLPE